MDTIQLMMLLCMALAGLSSLLSALMVGKRKAQREEGKRLLPGKQRSIRPVSQGVRK
jgi:hypothetical protein